MTQGSISGATPSLAALPGDIDVSFEFFPPKSETMAEQLWTTFETLQPLGPRFVSVTYGAGGTTRERTHATVARIAELGVPVAAHLTCVGASRSEIDEIVDAYWESGVRHIVALRGDMPVPTDPFSPHPDGYDSAAALVEGIAKRHAFEISVAAYPEVHPTALSAQADLDNLKRKLDAGANRALTQFFFEPQAYLRFRDQAAAAGIDAEIVPGILPISNVAQTRKFAAMCGAQLPDWMERLFEGLDDRPVTRQLVAATTAAALCRELYAEGVRSFHFYTLNRSELSYATCHMLGLRPAASPIVSGVAA